MRNRLLAFLLSFSAVFALGAGDINQNPQWPSTVQGSMLVDAITPFEITDGLVHRWPFDEGSGNTIADVIGGADLTNAGGTWATSGGKDIITLDGINDYLYAASMFEIPQSEGTIAIKWRPEEALASAIHPLFRAKDNSESYVFDVYPSYSGTGYFGWLAGVNDDRIAYAQSWTIDTWYWLFLTWKTSEKQKLYTDGVLDTTGANNLDAQWDTTASDFMYVGSDGSDYSKFSVGEMRLYEKRLVPDEIAAIAAGQ